MNNPHISIIIVNWNGGEVFNDCLKTLAEIDHPRWELIVVDNGSTDNSGELPLQYKKIKELKFVKNKTNLGFARANNQGFAISKGEYILLLNNDTKVTPDFLSKLVERMEQDSLVGVIQPKIFIMDKPGFLDNAGSFLTWTGFLSHWGFMQKDGPDFDREKEIFSAKGACMMIKRQVIEKVGLFDDDFGSYFEETDFCWRVYLAGYRIIYYPKTYIYHKVGFSSKKQNQFDVNYHSLKNRLDALIKNLDWYGLIKILPVHLFLLCGLSVFYLMRFNLQKSLMIPRAISWNLLNLKTILQKRSKAQRIRVVSDRKLLKVITKPFRINEMLGHFIKVEGNFK